MMNPENFGYGVQKKRGWEVKNSVIVVQVEAWFEAEEGVHDKNPPPQYFERFCTVWSC